MVSHVLNLCLARASTEKVDIVQLLENASIPTYDHLRIDSSDGPAARQIKELTAELKKLRGDLEEKENLLKASRVSPSDANSGKSLVVPTVSWAAKVSGAVPVTPRM